jgi:Ni,Fe-hydrogenase I small subunit
MGTLAAAVGMSQMEISKITEAFAGNSATGVFGPGASKPKVIWLHGAECTGCSTSLLGFKEDALGHPFVGDSTTTLHDALALAGVRDVFGNTTNGLNIGLSLQGALRTDGALTANIADVVIDVIDLQYHETVMGMGGDLAAQWLHDFIAYTPVASGTNPGDYPFVLVVEGALQDRLKGGAWGDTTATTVPWCSIGKSDDGTSFEIDTAEAVVALAKKSTCAAIIPIGQCASFGGYPGCKPRITTADAGFTATMSQTGAMGVYDYLTTYDAADTAAIAAATKVINVPGCPTNPWWFCLTVVMLMADLVSGTSLVTGATSLDNARRPKLTYPIPVHSSYCPRYKYYNRGVYAAKPGDPGCLQKLGCKGIATNSLCGAHGWNDQQPQNASSISNVTDIAGRGGHCTTAGHPCMACTEKGYPDSFVPFVKR